MKYAIIALGFVLTACQHPKPKIIPESVNTGIVGVNLRDSKDIADQIEKKADFILKNWEVAK
jgi:hypothetical protein